MAVLPPNVTAAQFEAAIKQLRSVVGSDWVFTDDADLHPYRDHFSPINDEPNELVASAAVSPTSTEQVQAIVRIANQYRLPLYTISTGKNYGYGGASPNVRGSVIVDLKRMDKVLQVDDKRHFALVEPGVSYFDLYRYIQERGLKVWIDNPDPGWGSLAGNALDRGMGYTQGMYRDHWGAHCGLEVVLANGEVMRTGMGAMAHSDTWQEYKHGFGPDPAGLFAQGNFGIVTKFGIRLMPQPEYYRVGLITVPKRADLGPLINVVNYLGALFALGQPIYGSPLRQLARDPSFMEAITRPGEFNDAELDRFAASYNLHSFSVELSFYGSERTTLANWEYAKELAERDIPGVRFVDSEAGRVPFERSKIRRSTAHGIPTLEVWGITGRSERAPDAWNQTHYGLFSVIPRTAEAVFKAQRVWLDASRRLDFPTFTNALSTPNNWQQFAFHMGTVFGAIPDNSVASKKAWLSKVREMIRLNAEHGWGDYRASPILQDDVSDQYDFNNHVLRRFNETLKDAADPNGILSPGRGGVWPKPYRSLRGSFRT